MLIGDVIIMIFLLVTAIVLLLVRRLFEENISRWWKLFYLIPVVAILVYTTFAGLEKCLVGAYLACVIMAIGYLYENAKIRKNICIAAMVFISISALLCVSYKGYRKIDFEKDFQENFDFMKDTYVLSEYKDIDWDGLYNKYMPLVKEANKKHDDVEYYSLLSKYTKEFRDGHVYVSFEKKKMTKAVGRRLMGNDYGLSLMTLDNGNTVAVNVDPESEIFRQGIKNGTVITKWDNVEIDKLLSEYDNVLAYMPDKENEEFYKPLYLAGEGGESVNITFLDDGGKEQNTTVNKIGYYYDRFMKTMKIIDQGIECENLQVEDLNEEVSTLRIKFMQYGSEEDESGDYSKVKDNLRENLLKARNSGHTKLILDLRANGGGSGEMVKAIVSLLAPKGEHFYAYDGVYDEYTMSYKKDANGKYMLGEKNTFTGEDIWEGNPIIVLVNAESGSAADHMALLLSRFDNVSVYGFTKSNCSGQGLNGQIKRDYRLGYSSVLILDENQNIFVDADSNGNGMDILSKKIAFDEAAVKVLFDDKEDYLLNMFK